MKTPPTADAPPHEDPIKSLTEIVMAGFERMDEGFSDLRTELRSLRRDVEALTEQQQHQSGYATEIDAIMARLTALEKHLGVNQNINA